MIDETSRPKGKTALKLLREIAEKTQGDVAQDVGVSSRNVRDWENKGSMPSLDKAALLARSLGVSFKVLCRAMGVNVEGIPDDRTEGGEEA